MLLTFEGIDGSGKSTQVRLLAERLKTAGHRPVVVREPGGTELSERVRRLLMAPDLEVGAMAELLLFSAARAQLVEERIRPTLEKGRAVLCDRFYDSTTAYQGAGRHLSARAADTRWLDGFHRRVTGGLVPDRTYLIEITPEQARERLQQRGKASDRMEAAQPAFHQRVAAAYTALADRYPERIRRLDGTRSAEALHETIWEDIRQGLGGSW